MSRQKSSLSDILRSQNTVVFKGTQSGGKLFPVRGVPIPEELDSLPKSVILERYNVKFYVTLTHIGESGNLFEYTLDEATIGGTNDNQWYRQLGVGHIAGSNQIFINETDGMQGLISKQNGELFLYRSRTGESTTVMHSYDIRLSTSEKRDRDLGIITGQKDGCKECRVAAPEKNKRKTKKVTLSPEKEIYRDISS